jgi:F-type H+-transporting ATPase subunit b
MRTSIQALVLGALLAAAPAFADDHDHGHDHGAAEAAHPGEAPAHGSGSAEHGEHGGHDAHAPTIDDVNWYFGILGERDDVEPSLLYRPTGMPVPFAALLFNTAILFYVLYRLGGRPISEGLKNRKQTLLRGMDEAAKMKREAEEQLKSYELKLERIDDEVERVKREMQASGETERQRVLAEARERRARMERDARQLVEQELKAVRDRLLRETVESAVRSATETLTSKLSQADQERLADEYVAGLSRAAAPLRGRV